MKSKSHIGKHTPNLKEQMKRIGIEIYEEL